MSPKRLFLYTLIGSVALSALIGVGVILFGDFGRLEIQILMSTLTVTVTSILGLACGAYYESGKGGLLPKTGIVVTIIAAVMTFLIIWNVLDDSELFTKTAASMMLLSVAISHVCLLSMASLDTRFQWARPAAYLTIGTLTALLLFLTWSEFDQGSEAFLRAIGVLSILVAAITVVTPVLHKLSDKGPDIEGIEAEIGTLRKRIAELEEKRDRLAGG